MTIQIDVTTLIEPVTDFVIRRPAVPRWWDPVSRPHVAIVLPDPVSGTEVRYYLSKCGDQKPNGRNLLEVSDIDSFPEGTLVEVRFSATKANLYRLEMVGTVPCWRWIARSQGLHDFETEAISWDIDYDDDSLNLAPVGA